MHIHVDRGRIHTAVDVDIDIWELPPEFTLTLTPRPTADAGPAAPIAMLPPNARK